MFEAQCYNEARPWDVTSIPWASNQTEQGECPNMAVSYIPYSGEIITRVQAKALGLKRYFMGSHRPCRKHGHVSERKTVDGQCIACTRVGTMTEAEVAAKRARTKNWDDAHRDQKHAVARELYEQNESDRPRQAACAMVSELPPQPSTSNRVYQAVAGSQRGTSPRLSAGEQG